MAIELTKKTMDGNEAAAYTSYADPFLDALNIHALVNKNRYT